MQNITSIIEQSAPVICAVILLLAVLAVTVSIITQITKDLGILSRIPTKLQVIVVSILLCLLAFAAASDMLAVTFTWWSIPSVIVFAFFVAFLAMYGWEQFFDVWNRFVAEIWKKLMNTRT